MLSLTDISIRTTPFNHPDALPMRAAQRSEMIALGVDYPLTAKDIPVFFLAYDNGVAVGCGGLRPVIAMDGKEVQGCAEVKRMFVAPGYRGARHVTKSTSCEEDNEDAKVGKGGAWTSVAMLLLARLEKEARRRGWELLVLTTASCLVGANKFYRRCGFVPCKIFGKYREEDESLYYEKRLLACATAVNE